MSEEKGELKLFTYHFEVEGHIAATDQQAAVDSFNRDKGEILAEAIFTVTPSLEIVEGWEDEIPYGDFEDESITCSSFFEEV